jgi:hypothetical protein
LCESPVVAREHTTTSAPHAHVRVRAAQRWIVASNSRFRFNRLHLSRSISIADVPHIVGLQSAMHAYTSLCCFAVELAAPLTLPISSSPRGFAFSASCRPHPCASVVKLPYQVQGSEDSAVGPAWDYRGSKGWQRAWSAGHCSGADFRPNLHLLGLFKAAHTQAAY